MNCFNGRMAALVFALHFLGFAVFKSSTAHGQSDDQANRLVEADQGALRANLLQTKQYQPESEAWDGISTLVKLGKGLGYEVAPSSYVDWSDIGADDIVVLLYPTGGLDANHVADFVTAGGRLLIADDFGRGSSLFARLGLLLDTREVKGKPFLANYDFIVSAQPAAADQLRKFSVVLQNGLGPVMSNHPASFADTGSLVPLFVLPSGKPLVAAGAYGLGKIIACSDPSVFINRMLEMEGNLAFATFALRYLMPEDGPKKMVLLTDDFRFSGEPVPPESGDTFADFLALLNRIGQEANAYTLTENGAKLVALIFAALLAFFAFRIFPTAPTLRLDGAWTRPAAVFSNKVVSRRRRENTRNLASACAIRDVVLRRLSRQLTTSGPISSFGQAELRKKIEAQIGKDAAKSFDSVYAIIRGLPETPAAKNGFKRQAFSKSKLSDLAIKVDSLYSAIDRAAGAARRRTGIL